MDRQAPAGASTPHDFTTVVRVRLLRRVPNDMATQCFKVRWLEGEPEPAETAAS